MSSSNVRGSNFFNLELQKPNISNHNFLNLIVKGVSFCFGYNMICNVVF